MKEARGGGRRGVARAAIGVAAVVWWGLPAATRAAVTYELSPATSVGATSNAQAISQGSASVVSGFSAVGRIRAEQLRANESLGVRVGMTHYFDEGAQDGFSNEVIGASSFELAQPLNLSLGANGVLTRTSNVTVAPAPGQAAVPGSRLYVSWSARENLTYAATERFRLSQGFGVGRVDYLSSSADTSPTARPTMTLGADLHADYGWRRDSLSLTGTASELIAGAGVDPLGMPVAAGNTLLVQGMLGWRRDLSQLWWAQLQGGVAALRAPTGEVTTLPAAVLTVEYRQFPWYTTLMVTHAPVANLFLGVATINDQVSLGLTVPLDRGELVVLAGLASYAHAHAADQANVAAGAYDYDQWSVGSILSVRFRTLPMFGSVSYGMIDQHGTSAMGGQALEIVRHTVTLNLTAVFQWGPGTPPLLGGGALL